MSIEALHRHVLEAYRDNFQICVHAIGDRALSEILSVFEVVNLRASHVENWTACLD